jgi:hypothetical protein
MRLADEIRFQQILAGGPGSGRKPEAFHYKMATLIKPYTDPYTGKTAPIDTKTIQRALSPYGKNIHDESLLEDTPESRIKIANHMHGPNGWSNFPVHVYNRGELMEKGKKAMPLYTVTDNDYDKYMKAPDPGA